MSQPAVVLEHYTPGMASRCVIVAGFPRSGTSWLAKGLSFAPGFTYYREPDNHDRVAEAEERFAWLYLTADRDDPAYRDLMTRACAGRIATAFTMRDDPGRCCAPLGRTGRWLGERIPALFRRKPNVLLKLVFANLNLDWLGGALSACPAAVRAAPSLWSVRELASAWLGAQSQTACWKSPSSWPTTCTRSPICCAERVGSGSGRGALGRDGVRDPPADAARVPARDRGVRVALRRPGGAVPGAVPPARAGLDRGGRALPDHGQPRRRRAGPTRCTAWPPSRWTAGARDSPRARSTPAAVSSSRSSCPTILTSSPRWPRSRATSRRAEAAERSGQAPASMPRWSSGSSIAASLSPGKRAQGKRDRHRARLGPSSRPCRISCSVCSRR